MPDGARDGAVGQPGRRPAVETGGRELAFEHGRGVEEDARRLDAAGEHGERLGVEVEVVGLACGHRRGERVAVAAAGAPDPLQVVRLPRRHRAEHHRGQVADVDAQFQGGRRREQVRLPRPRVRVGEARLQAVPLVARQQRGVLGRDQAPDGRLAVQAAEPGGGLRLVALVDRLHAEVQAGRAQPQVRFPVGHHEGAVRPGAAQDRGAGGGVEAGRVERPRAAVPRGLQAAHEARVFEGPKHLAQDVLRLARRGQRVGRRQDLLNPVLVPRAPGTGEQRFQAVGRPGFRREHGQRRPPAEVLQRGPPRELPAASPARQPRARGVAANGAAVLHAPQYAEDQRARRRRFEIAQRPELLADAHMGAAARLLQGLAVGADGRGPRPLQGAADGRPVAQLGQRVPAQPLGDQRRQPRAGRQPAVVLQRREVAPPLPVRRDELADEAFVVERLRVDRPVAPPRLHPRGQLGQRDAVVPFDDLRDGRAQPHARRPRREEPGAVRGVLDVVREGDHLAVVVVARSLRLPQRDAQQAGGARADDDQRLVRVAVRTVAVQLRPPGLAPAPELDRRGAEDAHEAVRAAAGASGRVRGVHGAARAADGEVEAARAGRRRGREQERHVDVAQEEPVVEHPQVAFEARLGRPLDGPPAGDPALAALHERQVQRGVVRFQVVEEAQPAGRPVAGFRRFLGRPLRRFLVQAAHHAPQLAHPQVQGDLQERPQRAALAAPRCRDQGAQPVQDAGGLGVVGRGQAAAEPLDDLGQRRRAAVQHPQQVHERRVLAQPVGQRHAPRGRLEAALQRFAEEQLVLRPDVLLGRRMARRVHAGRQVVRGQQVAADDGAAEEGVDALPGLAHDGPRFEGLAEEARDVAEQLRFAGAVAEGRRRAGADQPVARGPQPRPQAADQAREVGPLGAVEGVQLVDHQIAQRVGPVVAPQPEVERPDQQVVQHLVVRQQDVRRALAQRVAVGDHVPAAHRPAGRRRLRLVVAPDEHPGRHPAAQRGRAVDDSGDAPRLVRGQRVHRVDEDGLDARRAGLPPAVVEHREEEALRLARAGAGGHHRRPPGVGGQPRERRRLVAVRREPQGHFRERLARFRRRLERQGDGEVRPLRQVLGVGEEVVHDRRQRGVRRREAGGEEVAERARDLRGDDGGDHRDSALGMVARILPRAGALDVPSASARPSAHRVEFASRADTSRFRLTPSSAAWSASSRCVSGGTRTMNRPL